MVTIQQASILYDLFQNQFTITIGVMSNIVTSMTLSNDSITFMSSRGGLIEQNLLTQNLDNIHVYKPLAFTEYLATVNN